MRVPRIASGSPPAVIVGFELNGLGVARALARHGVECIGLTGPIPHPAASTNSCRVIACAAWSREAVLRRLLAIGKEQKRRLPLLITKEGPVRWISDARAEIAELYDFNLPSKPVVDGLLDKASFARRCEREGWPIPRTWRITTEAELRDTLHELPFPCILKPEVHTYRFGESSPRKAFKVVDAAELLSTYRLAAQWTRGFVLQEWIQGGDDRIAFCLTYVGRDGTPLAAFPGRKLRQYPPECGNTAMCEPAPLPWRRPIGALTEKVWRSVNFSGLGSIEYKMRLGSDQPVIIEPTVGRTNYQNELAVLNGINIPLIAYCDLAGVPLPSTVTRSPHRKLVDGLRELSSARHYLREGRLSRRQWLRDRSGSSRYMTWRVCDSGPFFASVRQGLRALAGRLVERLFGRAGKLRLKSAIHAVRGS
jgi:predicted ATP-grasp superfamily ATP-dependent carboligase